MNAKKIAGLEYGQCVQVDEIGETVVIDGIEAPWVCVKIPPKAKAKTNSYSGWVFGGYLSDEFGRSSSSVSGRNKKGASRARGKSLIFDNQLFWVYNWNR